MTANNSKIATKSGLELVAIVQHSTRASLYTGRLVAVELGKKFGHLNFSAFAETHRLDPATKAALETTAPTHSPSSEQPKNLNPSITPGAPEEAPRSAVLEATQNQADDKVPLTEPDRGRRHLGRNNAFGPQTRDSNRREIVSERSHSKLCSQI
jgi:hypothetical protein